MKRQLQERKKPTREESRLALEFQRPSLNDEWGGATVINKRMPSGKKLILKTDEDCILRYLGSKDVSEAMGKPDGSVIYFNFFDGKEIVTMPASYAFRTLGFQQDYFYYIWHQGDVDMGTEGKNPMKDFLIRELGVSDDTIKVPSRIADKKEFVLSDSNIKTVNYSRLNYPFRD